MTIKETIASLQFFTELCAFAMQHDMSIMTALTAAYERRYTPRKRTLTAVAAKKGPKNLLVAAASVQARAV